MENHPLLCRRIRRVRRIQVCMARKGLKGTNQMCLSINLEQSSLIRSLWLLTFLQFFNSLAILIMLLCLVFCRVLDKPQHSSSSFLTNFATHKRPQEFSTSETVQRNLCGCIRKLSRGTSFQCTDIWKNVDGPVHLIATWQAEKIFTWNWVVQCFVKTVFNLWLSCTL